MEQLAINYVSMDDPGILVTNYCAAIIGGVIGWIFFKPNLPMRRLNYYVLVMALLTVMTIIELIFVNMSSSNIDFITVMFVVKMVSLVGMGLLLYRFSAARAIDIDGSTTFGVLVFIPIAGLYLVFKRGEDHASRAKARNPAARYLFDPFIILATFIVYGFFSLHLDKAEEQAMKELAMQERYLRGSAVAKAAADGFEEDLPMQIDEITTLSSVKADGDSLVYTYYVDTDASSLLYNFERTVITTACREDGLKPLFELNMQAIYYYYRASDSKLLHRQYVGIGDCR